MQRPSYRQNTLIKTKRRRHTFLSDEDDRKDIEHIDDVLREIGFGVVQWWVYITAGFLLMSFVCETMGMAILSIEVKCDLDMNYRDVANLRTAAFIGVITSSFLWGYLCDRFGRRKLLLISIHCATVFSLASMFSNHYITFFIMRFFTGFFIAGPSFIAMVYVIEFVPPEKRATMVNYTYLFNGFGMLYAPGTAHFITQQTWRYEWTPGFHFRPWRLLGMVYTLPGIVGCILLWTLPESAYFYLSAGKDELALKVLNWIANKNNKKSLHTKNITQVGGVRRQSDDKRQVNFPANQAIFQINQFYSEWWHFFGFYQVFQGTSLWLIISTLTLIFGLFIM